MNKHEIAIRTKTVRDLLDNPQMRKQMEMAIPKHLTVDRLLRTVMTAIRENPVLLDCTQESLLAAVMATCQLGLEPEPFLGQAYLVPFKGQVVFIPGYRGYIALARRSGEVQSVSSQVVYERDYFKLQYGTDEKLEHIPTDGDRGNPKGAYVIFKYKDGGHSFDYMTTADIDRIRENFSKQPNGLMWKDNWAEGAKKTVIRRHVKLVPLAVEIQRAAALEDRAYGGESQFDMVFPEIDGRPQINGGSLGEWQNLLAAKCGDEGVPESLTKYIKVTAEANEMTEEQLVIAASRRFDEFWHQYETWAGKETKKRGRKAKPKDTNQEEKAPREPTSEAETEAEPPEGPESDDTAPIGVHKTLLSQIMKKVVGTNNIEQAKMLVSSALDEQQMMKLVNFLATQKKALEAEEWHKKRDEILGEDKS